MSTYRSSSVDQVWSSLISSLEGIGLSAPVTVLVTCRVDASREPQFLQVCDALAAATRQNRGAPKLGTYRSSSQAGQGTAVEYLLRQDWSSGEDCRTYWSSDDGGFLHEIAQLCSERPQVQVCSEQRQSQNRGERGRGDYTAVRPDGGNIFTSAIGFSWAMSLFGAQQMAALLTPGRSANSLDRVTQAAQDELVNPLRAAFTAGDAMQRGFLGTMLAPFSGGQRNRTALSRQPAPATQEDRRPTGTAARQAASPSYPATTPQRPTAPVQSPPPPKDTQPGVLDWGPPSRQQAPRPDPAKGATSAGAGWGPMPAAPVSRSSSPTSAAPRATQPGIVTETNISADFPFEPHYIDVLGSRMHYIEEGCGEPILLLHGNPTWSYAWRNIIPHLSSLGRCIAPDLIGYGLSAKPPIDYRWSDHVRYVEEFIRLMGLRNIILVLHDQGSGLGFHYAMRHESNIRGIAFFEALVRPFEWDNFSTPEFRTMFRAFRTGGVGGEGWKLIVDQNVFIEQLLPQASGRQLSEREMNFYREPFRNPDSRLPVWRFPRETAIGGEPGDVWDAVTEYSNRLRYSRLPKLMLYATPGALLTEEHVDWCQQNIRNLESIHIGPGIHFLEESSPKRIGQEVAAWIQRLSRRR